MQVTVLFGATLMVAVLPDVVALPPPSAVQVKLSNTKFAGSAPSVTVYVPAKTESQCSVLAVPVAIGDAGSTPALSFRVKLSGVVSTVQPDVDGIVEVKLKSWFRPRGLVCLMMLILPQLLMFTGCGATKSFTSDGNAADERLFRNTLPNAWHVPAGNTPAAVRLTAASPKVPAGRDTLAIGSFTVTALTAPSASPRPLRSTRLPQQGSEFAEKHWLVAPVVTHRSRPSTGLPLPPKSNVMSRSPALRLSVFGPVVVRSGWASLLISKSMFAEPRTFVRSQAR